MRQAGRSLSCWRTSDLRALALASLLLGLGATAIAGDSPWQFDAALEIYGYMGAGTVNDSSVNPSNEVLELPNAFENLDLRPSADLSYSDRVKVIFQPRWQLGIAAADLGTNGEFHTQSSGFDQTSVLNLTNTLSVSQGYVQANLTDFWIIAAGVQNYQWGPAELLTPSNPMIHFTEGQRSILWVERGRGIVRTNFSIGQNLTLVLLGDVFDNDLTPANSGGYFNQLGMGKLEYQVSPSTYFGLTGGDGISVLPWVGEYGSIGLMEGWTLYGDARHTQGNNAYYPVYVENEGYTLQQTDVNSQNIQTLLDAGIRYEGSVDIRSEFILNTAGYTREQFQEILALESLNPSSFQEGYIPGMEVPGMYYLYESIRIPNLGYRKKLTLSARYIHSLMDQSGVAFLSGERGFSDNASGFFEVGVSHGGENSEFTLTEGVNGFIGIRFAL